MVVKRRGPRAPDVDPYQTDADFDAALIGLRAYTEQFWDIFHPDDPYVGGYPMDCICAHYEEWMNPDGSIQNLIVNQPFRTGKSTLLLYAMTYRWLTHPSTRWMFATYNQGLSNRDSIRCRKLIKHPRYQAMFRRFTGQPLTINADQDTQRLFVNNHEGFRMALTVGKGLGEGGHYLVCFRSDTLIQTDRGEIEIGRIVEERLPVKVLAYDHATGEKVYREIEKYERSPGRRMVKVNFSNGREFACTFDHPVYVEGRGYIGAEKLEIGDKVVTCARRQYDLRHLCGHVLPLAGSSKEGEPRSILFDGMQRQGPKGRGKSVLRRAKLYVQHLWESLLQIARPQKTKLRGGILLAPLPRNRADRQRESNVYRRSGSTHLPGLPGQISGRTIAAKKVRPRGFLLGRVSVAWTSRRVIANLQINRRPMLSMRNRDRSETASRRETILLENVCRHLPFIADGRPRKSTVLTRAFLNSLLRFIPGHSERNTRARRELPRVRNDSGRKRGGTFDPPHELQQGGQSEGESDRGLQVVPRLNARERTIKKGMEGETVISVKSAEAVEHVYNVSVREHHNYFAAGVLVHNCDDPIDPTKARHRSQREFCVDWYRSTWRHRTAGDPKKVRRLVVQQRINQADLSGYLMENEGHEWEQLVLPMRYEPKRIVFGPMIDQEKATTQTDGEVNAAVLAKQMAGQADKATDPIRFTSLQNRVEKWQDNAKGSGRVNSGDLLWPQRFPESWVRSTESTLGKDAAGQLQQRPSSATGNVFRVEKAGAAVGRFDVTEKFLGIELFSSDGTARLMPADHWRWFQIGDTATKTSQENSYTVIGTFALSDDGKLVLWHIFRDRLEVPDQYPAIKEMKRGPCTWDNDTRKAVRLGAWPAPLLARYLEPKSSGIGLIQTSIIDGEPIRSLDKVPGDKVERAGHAAALYEAGSMYHRAGPWLSTAVEELRLFPNADFDDVADVVSYAGHVAATDKLLRSHINRRVVLNIQETKATERQKAAIPEAALDAIMG